MRKMPALLFAVLALCAGARAEEPAKTMRLTLEDFLSHVPREDARFRRILLDRLALKYRKDLALPVSDWVVSVLGRYEMDAGDVGEAGEDEEGTFALNLAKLFPRTGTLVEAQAAGDAEGSSQGPEEWEVGLTQDIARNAFGRAVRMEEAAVGLEIELAEHQVVEAYEDYLAILASSYLDWYYAWENLKTTEASYQESLSLLSNVQERQRRNVALAVDVDKVRLQVLGRQEQAVRLKSEVRVMANLIRRAMKLPGEAEIAPDDPTRRWELPAEGDGASLDSFESNSRTARILQRAEERSAKLLRLYADDLLPSVKLGLVYSESETEGQDAEQRIAGSLSLAFPFGRQRERARYETAKIEREQARLAVGDVLSRVRTDLANLLIRIHMAEERIRIAEEKIALAEGILSEERENYSMGRTTLNDLIRFIDSLEESRFSLITREVERTRLLLEYMRLSDRLVNSRDVAEE